MDNTESLSGGAHSMVPGSASKPSTPHARAHDVDLSDETKHLVISRLSEQLCFKEMDPASMEALLAHMECVTLDEGAVVLNTGDLVASIYVIEDGECVYVCLGGLLALGQETLIKTSTLLRSLGPLILALCISVSLYLSLSLSVCLF